MTTESPTATLLALCVGPQEGGGPYTLRVVPDEGADELRVTLHWTDFRPDEVRYRLMERGYTVAEEDIVRLPENCGWTEVQANAWSSHVTKDPVEFVTATVTIREGGDWYLTVEGTDIERQLWSDRDVSEGTFPGNAMGHRLIEVGYLPNRAAANPALYPDPARKLAAAALGGWQPVGENTWTIPCVKQT